MAESSSGGVESGSAGQPTRRAFMAAAAALGLPAVIPPAASTRAPRARPRLAAVLTNLQLAGQRVISSYPGLTPPASLFSDITAAQTAGVIFFGENISSDSQIAAVITQLRQAPAQSTG